LSRCRQVKAQGRMTSTRGASERRISIRRPAPPSSQLSFGGGIPTCDVTLDGQRFVLPEAVQSEDASAEAESGDRPPATIHIVQNWYEEFRDRQQD